MTPTNPIAVLAAASALTGEPGGRRRTVPWAAVDCPPDDRASTSQSRLRRFPRLRGALRPRAHTAS
jgi:hypothetical protein